MWTGGKFWLVHRYSRPDILYRDTGSRFVLYRDLLMRKQDSPLRTGSNGLAGASRPWETLARRTELVLPVQANLGYRRPFGSRLQVRCWSWSCE